MHLAFTDVRHDTVSYETSYNLLCKAAYAELKANSQSETTSKHWSEALKSSISAVSKYGGATAGYRTMLDALIPASKVLEEKLSVGEDPIAAFVLSAEAATAGAESTIHMKAQAGRSSYVSAEIFASIPDPGAMAAAAWYSAAARAVKEQRQRF
jgi:dihydroxyacetone kinase